MLQPCAQFICRDYLPLPALCGARNGEGDWRSARLCVTRRIQLAPSGDPKGVNFTYTNGKTVVVRNIEVCMCCLRVRAGRRAEPGHFLHVQRASTAGHRGEVRAIRFLHCLCRYDFCCSCAADALQTCRARCACGTPRRRSICSSTSTARSAAPSVVRARRHPPRVTCCRPLLVARQQAHRRVRRGPRCVCARLPLGQACHARAAPSLFHAFHQRLICRCHRGPLQGHQLH